MARAPKRPAGPGDRLRAIDFSLTPSHTERNEDLINRAITYAALAYPPVRQRLEDLGAMPQGSTPNGLADFLQSEIDKWGPVIRDANIKLDN